MLLSRLMPCAALVGTVLSAPALHAQEWFVGAGIGRTSPDLSATEAELKAEVDFDDAAAIPGVISSAGSDEGDSGLKLLGGRRFNEHFAIELGYADLGEGTTTVAMTAEQDIPVLGVQDGEGVVLTETDSITGFSVAAIGRLPLSERLSVQGRVGVYAYELEYDFLQTDTTGLFGGDYAEADSESDAELFYGLSFDIAWRNGLAFSLFYETYGSGGGLADFTGVSLTYAFGDQE